jgi:hypothetical protein
MPIMKCDECGESRDVRYIDDEKRTGNFCYLCVRAPTVRFPLACALLDFWSRPYLVTKERFILWALLRMRARGVDVLNG